MEDNRTNLCSLTLNNPLLIVLDVPNIYRIDVLDVKEFKDILKIDHHQTDISHVLKVGISLPTAISVFCTENTKIQPVYLKKTLYIYRTPCCRIISSHTLLSHDYMGICFILRDSCKKVQRQEETKLLATLNYQLSKDLYSVTIFK